MKAMSKKGKAETDILVIVAAGLFVTYTDDATDYGR